VELKNAWRRDKDGVNSQTIYLPRLKPLRRLKKIDEKELKEALRRYYALRGWDENGVPTGDAVKSLLLELAC